MDDRLPLEWLPGRYAVCRLEPGPPPSWLQQLWVTATATARDPNDGSATLQSDSPTLLSITRRDRERSVVIDERLLPMEVAAQRGFAGLRVAGVLDFAMVGLLARLTAALAEARVPVFVISTYETDVLLLPSHMTTNAWHALQCCADIDAPPAHLT